MSDQGKNKPTLQTLIAKLASSYLRFVVKTSDFQFAADDLAEDIRENQPAIFAFWHGQFLLIPQIRPDDVSAGAMVARHEDADLLGAVLEEFDIELIRGAGAGSRKRDRGGAAALRTCLTALSEGKSVALTADVPPGPARRLGEGIIAIARMSGRPIVPIAVATSRFRTLNTWSRLTINLPFSKIGAASGGPVFVPRTGTPETYETIRRELEEELSGLTARVYEIAGAIDNPKAPISGRPTPPGFGALLYRTASRALEPVGKTILSRRARRGKEDKARQNERLGHPTHPRPDGRLAWFHAASVGELNAIRQLLTTINQQHPALQILVTTGTVTSAQIAEEQLADIALHQYVPLDGPNMVRRFLDHWRPDAVFLVESEIWPNLIYQTSERKIPLVLLNATLSDKSAKAWRALSRKRTAASLFTRFDRVLAQTPTALLRFTRLGVSNVEHVGNLKLDSEPPRVDDNALANLRREIGPRPILLAASTHPGEDEQVMNAHRQIAVSYPDLLTIIAPRHPERGPEIAALAIREDLQASRRSAENESIQPATEIYVADTIGELGLFYSLTNVTFVGGSLVKHGGQNPIEAIRLGSPVILGPHTKNFADINATLELHGGVVRIQSAEELATEVMDLLAHPARTETLNAHATEGLKEMEGALEKTLQIITPYLTGDSVARAKPGGDCSDGEYSHAS